MRSNLVTRDPDPIPFLAEPRAMATTGSFPIGLIRVLCVAVVMMMMMGGRIDATKRLCTTLSQVDIPYIQEGGGRGGDKAHHFLFN